METYDILDENPDELPLTVYARKKAGQTGFWMIVTSAAGVLLFGTISIFIPFVEGVDVDDTEEIVLMLFLMCMTLKYAILLVSAIQTRQGAVQGRAKLLYRSVFNARIAWIFVGILALVFLLQVILYYTTGFEMLGELTGELFHINW